MNSDVEIVVCETHENLELKRLAKDLTTPLSRNRL